MRGPEDRALAVLDDAILAQVSVLSPDARLDGVDGTPEVFASCGRHLPAVAAATNYLAGRAGPN